MRPRCPTIRVPRLSSRRSPGQRSRMTTLVHRCDSHAMQGTSGEVAAYQWPAELGSPAKSTLAHVQG